MGAGDTFLRIQNLFFNNFRKEIVVVLTVYLSSNKLFHENLLNASNVEVMRTFEVMLVY